MTAAFIALTVAWGFARGFTEGIVMYFAAPRFHPWFGWYHAARCCEYGLLFGAGAVYAAAHPGPLAVIGALVLSWEAFEAAYLWARLGQAANHENILGVYPIEGAGAVLALHIMRVLFGVALIARGLL